MSVYFGEIEVTDLVEKRNKIFPVQTISTIRHSSPNVKSKQTKVSGVRD